MLNFLRLFREPLAENLEVPLLRLQDALAGLYENNVQPMLRQARRRGRAKESDAYQVLMGFAAGTAQRLKQAGLGRASAYRRVANILDKSGFKSARGGAPVSERTIRNWCQKVAEDVGSRGTARKSYDRMFTREENARFAQRSKEDARELAIVSFKEFIRIYFSEHRRNPPKP